MRILFALAAIAIVAGCRKSSDDADRRADSNVSPPVSVDTVSRVRNCGISGVPVLEDDGIGELEVGRRVEDIRERCQVLSDGEEPGSEGMKERVLVTQIGGETIRSIVNDNRVWRIEIVTPRIATRDSLGVDVSLHRLAARPGAKFVAGEDGVYGFVVAHCGLSFRFSIPLRPPKAADWTVAAIDKAHGDAVIDRVLVTRCSG